MNKSLKITFVVISYIVFLISLFQECYTLGGQPTVGSLGLIAFLLGWLNFSGIFFVWLANPLYLMTSILFLLNKKAQIITGFCAFALSLFFFAIDEIIINEGGMTGKIDGYLSGYYLWIGSIGILLFATLLNTALEKKPQHIGAALLPR